MERLAALRGVARLAQAGARRAAGRRTLADALAKGPLAVPELLQLSLALSRTLAAVHARGVLHRSIAPEYVLLNAHDYLLGGFDFATTYADERPRFAHHLAIRGKLPYLPPELTGRTGRGVAPRSDLYELGETLYEAATGCVVFVL